MIRETLRIYSLSIGLLVIAVSAAAQTGNPYYNVLDPAYGAKCDGSSHVINGVDTEARAFNNALTAANNNGGGLVFVPSTVTGACVITTQLNLDHFSGVGLSGPPGGNSGLLFAVGNPGLNPHPTILFTGTTSPLISMRSTTGVSIKNLTLQYNNPNFTGVFLDMSRQCDTCQFTNVDYVADSTIQGSYSSQPQVTATAAGATALIALDQAINVTIERNIFEWAVNAIVGPYAPANASNVIRIRDNLFSGYGTNSISQIMIANLATGWIIEGNTFEMGGPNGNAPAGFPIAIDAISVPCSGGCQITGNWFGDPASSYSGSIIAGTFKGTSITGNLISGLGDSPVGTGILLLGNSSGVSISGNQFSGLASALDFFGGGQSNVLISGNQYPNSAFSKNGIPSSGIVTDDTGATSVYGSSTGTLVAGNLTVNGFVSKFGGSFKIDHPLDPSNKYLSHSFVESPDMMNIYNGIVRLDAHGRAEVTLPAYFEALNQDFRYQLTPVGAFAPVYVAQKIKGNTFRIAGGKPGMEVSWQVSGIRHDAYANAHRIVVEEEKTIKDKAGSGPK